MIITWIGGSGLDPDSELGRRRADLSSEGEGCTPGHRFCSGYLSFLDPLFYLEVHVVMCAHRNALCKY